MTTNDRRPIRSGRPRRRWAIAGGSLGLVVVVVGLLIAAVRSDPGEEGSAPVGANSSLDGDGGSDVDGDTTSSLETSGPVISVPDLPIRPSLAPVISDAGTVNPFVNARTAFDRFTANLNPQMQQFLRDSFPLMLVYTPYFDDKVGWYADGMAYLDLYAIYNDETDQRSKTHPEWLLRDEDGAPLFIPFECEGGTCPQFAADPGDPSYQQHVLDQVRQIEQAGYRRLFVDDVNLPMRVSDGSGEPVAPVDRRTGEPMTEEQWATYVVELVELIREEFPGLQIAHNVIWFADSPQFSSELQWREIGAADYLMIERSFTDPGLVGGTGEFGFTSFLTWLEMLHREGRGLIFLDQEATTPAQHEYNIAGYLLVNEGKDVVGTESLELLSPPELWEGYQLDLGAANGLYYIWQGLYRRDFERGVVLLNPPDAQKVSVELEKPYRTLQDETVSSVILDEVEATILLSPDATDEE